MLDYIFGFFTKRPEPIRAAISKSTVEAIRLIEQCAEDAWQLPPDYFMMWSPDRHLLVRPHGINEIPQVQSPLRQIMDLGHPMLPPDLREGLTQSLAYANSIAHVLSLQQPTAVEDALPQFLRDRRWLSPANVLAYALDNKLVGLPVKRDSRSGKNYYIM